MERDVPSRGRLGSSSAGKEDLISLLTPEIRSRNSVRRKEWKNEVRASLQSYHKTKNFGDGGGHDRNRRKLFWRREDKGDREEIIIRRQKRGECTFPGLS